MAGTNPPADAPGRGGKSAPTTPPADGGAAPAASEADGHAAQHQQIDAKLDQHGGMLQQILDRLSKGPSSGSGPGAPRDPDEGKTVAELVREGVERLEREKQEGQDRDADLARALQLIDQSEARLAALEERQPSEIAATPGGRFRHAVQKWGYGIDPSGR